MDIQHIFPFSTKSKEEEIEEHGSKKGE